MTILAAIVTVFVGVNVVPMDSERVLHGQSVVVTDGKITEVGAVDTVAVPDGARVIYGAGRWIVPGLIEWAVREVGDERVLFGSDTPLYHAAMQRARIDHADLDDVEKWKILRDNAVRLFGLAPQQ